MVALAPDRRAAAALVVWLVASAAACGDAASEPAHARGVLVFLVDTLRADHLGCYGYERDTSPTIDAFASEAMVFEHCVANSSWTKPASASVLTGLFPAHHGATTETLAIRDDVDTLAEVFARNGWRTAAFFTNPWASAKHGFEQGFEVHEYVEGSEPERAPMAVDSALSFVRDVGDDPFFVYVHTLDPHGPYEPPEEWRTRFDRGYDGTVTGSVGLDEETKHHLDDLTEADRRHLIDLYDAEIAYTDQVFGRMLDGLRELGRYDDTLVVFVSDHGEEFGEYGRWAHNPLLFDPVVRVPLIVRFPHDPSSSGTREDTLCQQIDIAPTLLAATGLAPPADLPGRDLRTLDPDETRFALIESETGGHYRKAIVGGGIKLVRSWAPIPSEFVFDYEHDPDETVDLSGADEDRASMHRRLMDAHVAETIRGTFVLVMNGGPETVVAEIRVIGSAGFPQVSGLYVEGKPGMGSSRDAPPQYAEFERDGRTLMGSRILLQIAPNDGDGLRIAPADGEDELELSVLVDGEEVAPEYWRLGAKGERPDALPYLLDVASSDRLDSDMYPPRESLDGDPCRVRLWHVSGAEGNEVELTQDEIDAFRAIGYMGDE